MRARGWHWRSDSFHCITPGLSDIHVLVHIAEALGNDGRMWCGCLFVKSIRCRSVKTSPSVKCCRDVAGTLLCGVGPRPSCPGRPERLSGLRRPSHCKGSEGLRSKRTSRKGEKVPRTCPGHDCQCSGLLNMSPRSVSCIVFRTAEAVSGLRGRSKNNARYVK